MRHGGGESACPPVVDPDELLLIRIADPPETPSHLGLTKPKATTPLPVPAAPATCCAGVSHLSRL